ncbi:ATP-binding protein [Catenuloplanes atrovinosus]|uniref:AAA+ superfamily ATPase n=1 Tax=Catenuloplanes atrovinosus TaxID=137266 RepID=A0AAE3YKV2_9ACTN|nr:ATP-binding protein [Catenuloplanes atrovinosus]MDR7274285.1 putative AAA+ superfamily ATPase [Catenuloplanes atrovinosus]
MARSDLIPRRAQALVDAALEDTRVVLVNGARQSGKSTLVTVVAGARASQRRDLDLPQDREAALADPVGFVEFEGLMVIDEIQRAPDLMLAIKAAVDADPRPGSFLLSGSSRLLALRGLPDALPGRMETVELWPFSQGEIDGTPDRFVDAIFALGPALRHDSAIGRADYAARIVRGGMPEAVARADARRRGRFLDSYVQALIDRDVRQLADIERVPQLRRLIGLLAARSATIVRGLENDLELSRPTIARYLQLLDEIFLIKQIPGWSRNLGTRATQAPKMVFVDSGIAAQQLAMDAHALLRPGAPFGPLLEGFVLSELARQLTWSDQLAELSHYRDRDRVEVDAVLENRRGQVVGIEVKAASTVRSDDFRGLRRLEDRLGDDFVAGVVLYTGTTTLPFGERLRAMPVSALWQVAAPEA